MTSAGKWFGLAFIVLASAGCGAAEIAGTPVPSQMVLPSETPYVPPIDEDTFTRARLELVEKNIVAAGISNEDVLRAMRTVPRHEFVPVDYLDQAYDDHPLPIGY